MPEMPNFSGLQMSLKRLQDRIFRSSSDDAVDLAAVLENEQRWDALNAKTCRGPWVGIDIELADESPAGHFRGDLLDDGSDHPARTAPRGPEIEQNRQRRRLDDLAEICIGYRDGFVRRERQRLAAPA